MFTQHRKHRTSKHNDSADSSVEKADNFVTKETNEGFWEHGVRYIGVLEVVVWLSDHF